MDTGSTPNQEVICNGYLLGKATAKGSCVQAGRSGRRPFTYSELLPLSLTP